jgi:hypothetical protein
MTYIQAYGRAPDSLAGTWGRTGLCQIDFIRAMAFVPKLYLNGETSPTSMVEPERFNQLSLHSTFLWHDQFPERLVVIVQVAKHTSSHGYRVA